MEDRVTKFFAVQVKLQEETDKEDKAGNPKVRRWSEDYFVETTTSGSASQIVTEYMKDEYGDFTEWRIVSVKETKYLKVLDSNKE